MADLYLTPKTLLRIKQMLQIRKLDAFLDRGPDPVLHKRKNIKLAQLHDLRG